MIMCLYILIAIRSSADPFNALSLQPIHVTEHCGGKTSCERRTVVGSSLILSLFLPAPCLFLPVYTPRTRLGVDSSRIPLCSCGQQFAVCSVTAW